WGPRAIEDHGAPVSLPKLKKAYEKEEHKVCCPLSISLVKFALQHTHSTKYPGAD
ncbi:unnamed protein product, partial [Staurois parvus]